MAECESFNVAADSLIRLKNMLREKDLSDFQKVDLKAAWVKAKTAYGKLCLTSSDERNSSEVCAPSEAEYSMY